MSAGTQDPFGQPLSMATNSDGRRGYVDLSGQRVLVHQFEQGATEDVGSEFHLGWEAQLV